MMRHIRIVLPSQCTSSFWIVIPLLPASKGCGPGTFQGKVFVYHVLSLTLLPYQQPSPLRNAFPSFVNTCKQWFVYNVRTNLHLHSSQTILSSSYGWLLPTQCHTNNKNTHCFQDTKHQNTFIVTLFISTHPWASNPYNIQHILHRSLQNRCRELVAIIPTHLIERKYARLH